MKKEQKLYIDAIHGFTAYSISKAGAWMLIRSKCHELGLKVPTQDEIIPAIPVRVYGEEIVEQNEKCPFCETGKITSGTWLQTGDTGTPCCWSCYLKAKPLTTK